MEDLPIFKRPRHQLINCAEKENQDIHIVHFAVATSGLGQDSEICKIAAMGEDDETPWSVNILPDGEIPHSVSEYNGYTTGIGSDGIKYLFKHGVKVEACTVSEGLNRFLCHIIGKANASAHTTVLLGWNSQNFHIPLLLRQLKKCRVSTKQFEDSGVCYGDPYLMIKQRREQFSQLASIPKLDLPSVYQHLYPDNVVTHFDACNIVEMLKSVMTSLNILKDSMKDYSFTLSSAEKMRKYHLKVKKNLKSLEGKLYMRSRSGVSHMRGAITESMANKIAESGLGYRVLKKVHHRCGREGLETLLKQRVTRCQRVIDDIAAYFEQRKSDCK